MDLEKEKEKSKAKCQIFTPDKIVKNMLDYVGYSDRLYGKSILENSCGDGQFLREIVTRYIKDCLKCGLKSSKIKKGLETDIFGAEINKEHYQNCIISLDEITCSYGIRNVNWNIFNRDALRIPFEQDFCYVIGNPPYISYWDLDKDDRKFVKENYTTCQFGAWDYCYAFLQEGFNRLNTRGKMAMIIPNSIFKTKSGAKIRELLKPNITTIYDYTTTRVFEQVLTTPAVIVVDRASNDQGIEYNNLSENKTITLPKSSLNDVWVFNKYDDSAVDTHYRFGDYFCVAIGVATQLNSAFVLSGWKENNEILIKEDAIIEKKVVRRAASPKNKKRGKVDYIIFPYYYNNQGLLCRYDDDSFFEQFPNACKHLENYKEDLAERDADKQAKWFEYGRSQALTHINQKKLLISTIITSTTQVYELEEDEVPYSGLYITVKGDFPLSRAKAVLESEEFFRYVQQVGINANGKSIRLVAKNICDYRW